MAQKMDQIIDFDESQIAKRMCIVPGLDPELDQLKQIYHSLDTKLSEVVTECQKDLLGRDTDGLDVVYIPQIGFLITLPNKLQKETVDGLVYQFSTPQTVYYKSQRMDYLDETVGDVYTKIVDRELLHLQVLRTDFLELSGSFAEMGENLAQFDCLVSFAECALEYQYTRPLLSNTHHEMTGIRHPIVSLVVDGFISNPSPPPRLIITGYHNSMTVVPMVPENRYT